MKLSLSLISLAMLTMAGAQAAVGPDEAKQLGNNLTAVGAEKAGNKDGSIPAYAGGLTAPPAGYRKGDGIRPDPFAGEKPLFSVDAKNMAQYAGQLTEGVKALMKRYPSYRLDVYPTHRTAAFPKYVADNTAKCALSAKTANGGISMTGCLAGFPFPIPKDGFEAMWNHQVRFNGQSYTLKFQSFNVDASGGVNMAAAGTVIQEYPYWDSGKTATDTYFKLKVNYTGPARRNGEAIMVVDPLDYAARGRRAWQYLPGQRRVKLAPQIAFDAPNPSTAGATTYDDSFIFSGSMERYNFKLIGKKEMFVPYNAYKLAYASTPENVFKPNHLNPDVVRWERHRVWVVEATLAEGKRHIYSKRTFYLDEDSWVAVSSDAYDGRGQLYRSGFAYIAPSYELPAPFADMNGHYDLAAGIYGLNFYTAASGGVRYTPPLPEKEFTPESLAGSGVR
ncbi:MAG: DUF1329 domain-containing protein [Pseudomonadota bacterium]